MARLPTPGGDNGNWGAILNDYLSQALKPDGTIKDNAVTNSAIAPDAITAAEIQDGSIQEAQLASAIQTKLNAPGDWSTLTNKPAVVAAGANAAAARASIGAASVSDTSAFYARTLGNSMAIIGDSITDQNSQAGSGVYGDPTTVTNARGYFTWAQAFLGDRINWVKYSDAVWEFGAQNLTVAQIVSGGHVANLIAAAPIWALDASGTNSIQAGDSAASVFDQRRTGIWEPIQAAGIRLVITTLIPRDGLLAAGKQAIRDHNQLVRNYARLNPNVVLVDWHAAMADPTTGDNKSGVTSDGTHPSAIGARLMGEVVAKVLDPLIPKTQRMLDPFDERNMLRGNGRAYVVGGTELATSWITSGVGSGVTYVASKVASTDLIGGEVQRVAVTDASYNGISFQANTGSSGVANGYFVPGTDYVYGLMELETVSGTWDVKNFNVNVSYTGSTATAAGLNLPSAERTALSGSIRRPEGRLVVATPTRLVPAAATQVKIQLSVYGSGTFDIYRAALVRVTPADIATYGREWAGLPPL